MKKRYKSQLVIAILMAAAISALVIYASLTKQGDNFSIPERGLSPQMATSVNTEGTSSVDEIQRWTSENIQGEMHKGSFESTVESLDALTSDFGGIISSSNMAYDNELWTGTLDCNIPTENVTTFTFNVRRLISVNGTVTHIDITTTETLVNQTTLAEQQLSTVTIGLQEVSGGTSPVMEQLGVAVPWLLTGLEWIGEALIIGVPLCFVSLGIVMIFDRGIIPAWKRQLRARSTDKLAS